MVELRAPPGQEGEEEGREMSKEKHVGGLDVAKSKADLEAGLKDFLTKAAPDGLGIDPTKILKIDVKTDAAGKARGYGFIEVEDAVAAAVDVTGKDVPGLGKLTIKDSTGKPAATPSPAAPARPAHPAPAATPAATPPATPATPAAPARRTTTTRRPTWHFAALIVAIVILAIIAGIGYGLIKDHDGNAVDPEARQLARTADTKADQAIAGLTALRSDVSGVKNDVTAIREILERGQRQPPVPPAPAPVPPTPATPTPDHVGHHAADGDHYVSRRTRLDDHDDAIAALQARVSQLETNDAAHTRTEEVLVNAVGTHTCRGGHQPVVCQYMAEHFGRQFQ